MARTRSILKAAALLCALVIAAATFPVVATGRPAGGAEPADLDASTSAARAPCELPARTTADESPRVRNARPSPELRQALARFRQTDPDASFTFFNCEVDSFATRPKDTIPDYALAVLAELGLDTTPRTPELLSDPTASGRPTQDLDADLTRRVPLPEEPAIELPSPDPSDGPDDGRGDESEPREPSLFEERTEPPVHLEPRLPDFDPPSEEQLRREAQAVVPILAGFLARHEQVFLMQQGPEPPLLPSLQQVEYVVGRHFRKAVFEQTFDGMPVIDGRTLILFDVNWNVTAISRMLITPGKLPVDRVGPISQEDAVGIANRAVSLETGEPPDLLEPVSVTLGVEPVRRLVVWEVQLLIPARPEVDRTVLLDAGTGEILNVSDNSLAFKDAKVRRWTYTSGNVKQPVQVVSTGQYTRSSNTLTHDFFFMATDQRGGGNPLTTCPATSSIAGANTLWRQDAYGSTNSSSFIRHTHRDDRDFSIWGPAHSSGSFQESHTYYWSRWFFQWLKPALNDLGVLPANASNYPKALFILNACIDDIGLANSSFAVTTQHNEGETAYKLRLADLCRSSNSLCTSTLYQPSNSNHYVTCQGDGCHPTPSVIHHEIVHFILGKYFGVGSSLNCGSGNQLKFLHEGAMGSVVPQAFWHHWYGVGYNPNTDRLFTADQVRGRVHANTDTNLTRSAYPCSSNTTGLGPYNAGRVAGQPLWEFYHGRKVDGNTINNTWAPATNTDFLKLTFWAADLVAASTYKDRWEIANRVMEILDKHSNWSSNAKTQYCSIWGHHQLDTYINFSYCH